jgi:hypothetical protein
MPRLIEERMGGEVKIDLNFSGGALPCTDYQGVKFI